MWSEQMRAGRGGRAAQIIEDTERRFHHGRGYFAVGLDAPRSNINIATVLRACGCYGAAMLITRNGQYNPNKCDPLKHWKHMPLIQTPSLKDALPYNCTPIAVELTEDATPLHEFTHPERAFYIFGPEDGALDGDTLAWCPHRIMIPTRFCMNLAVCVNVVLYDRMAKCLAKHSNHTN